MHDHGEPTSRLMTVPGVGPVVALTYSVIDCRLQVILASGLSPK